MKFLIEGASCIGRFFGIAIIACSAKVLYPVKIAYISQKFGDKEDK